MKGKLRKILGLAISAAMAVSAVVPWTGMTAFAADGEVVNQLRIVISDELAEKVDVNGGPGIPSNERFLHVYISTHLIRTVQGAYWNQMLI